MLTVLVIFCALLLIAGTIYIARAPFLRIQTISVTGADPDSDAKIAEYVREQLVGNYSFFIPRNHVFEYRRLRLDKKISLAFPRLSSAAVTLISPTALSVVVSERLPHALWCGATQSLLAPCELLDENGAAYAPATFASSTAYVAYFGALNQSLTPAQFLVPEQFRALFALIDALASKAGAGAAASAAIDSQNDVSAQFQNGFVVRFSLSDATLKAGSILEHFSLALGSAPFQQHALKEFQYLDLRFGDSLYYKLKGDTTATGASTTRPY